MIGYASPGTNPADLAAVAQEAESLGYASAWVAETWGTDAVSVIAWLLAHTTRIDVGAGIMQIPARPPTLTAMSAATLDLLSGGRFLLGLGVSGPQVAEGWYGVAWGPPLARTREYVAIVRAALRREVVVGEGPYYPLPFRGDGATGLGIPLKLMLRPLRAEIPLYLAAIGPRNVELAAEIADGWLPVLASPEHLRPLYGDALGRAREGFDVAAIVNCVVADDVAGALDSLKPHVALYVGGMGARGKNFYNTLVGRYGYEQAAAEIQELYLGGKQREAIAAVPDALVDEVSLVGPKERIAERLAAWRECGVTTLVVGSRDETTLRTMAELVL